MKGRVLIIAGSDPSGGAGIQADIKTVTALGGYAATAITALTVQNTQGVSAVYAVAPELVIAQIDAVLSDIGADAIKIGMIADRDMALVLAERLESVSGNIPIVLDPVLAATSGDVLAGEGVGGVILEKLAPLCALITPNRVETEALTGLQIAAEADMVEAGAVLIRAGADAALIKGGHMPGNEIKDVLATAEGVKSFSNLRLKASSTHGTGCTLASAIATSLAQSVDLEEATARAINYVRKAIETAPGYGAGHGPLNHAHTVKSE